MIRAELWFEIPFREQESIKRKYNFGGPFVKIHFTSEVEREKAKKSTNAHFLGGKELRIHTYTPRRQTSVAPPIEKNLHAENEELGSDGIKGSSLSGRFVFPML
jgi:hypothetical protein